jgi:hypothetical protein
MIDKKKFLDKNEETIKRFKEYLKNNEVGLIIVSPEIFAYMQDCLEGFETHDIEGLNNYVKYHGKYDDIRVLVDVYASATTISFVLKENNIFMILPCICGIYPGENHDYIK